MKVNLFDFVNETPDKHFQQRIEQDKRYYLPPDLIPSGKKNPKDSKDIHVLTNLPACLNNESCADEGYTLIFNGYKGRGSVKDNASAICTH